MEGTPQQTPCPRAPRAPREDGHRKDLDVRVLVVEDEQLLAALKALPGFPT